VTRTAPRVTNRTGSSSSFRTVSFEVFVCLGPRRFCLAQTRRQSFPEAKAPSTQFDGREKINHVCFILRKSVFQIYHVYSRRYLLTVFIERHVENLLESIRIFKRVLFVSFREPFFNTSSSFWVDIRIRFFIYWKQLFMPPSPFLSTSIFVSSYFPVISLSKRNIVYDPSLST